MRLTGAMRRAAVHSGRGRAAQGQGDSHGRASRQFDRADSGWRRRAARPALEVRLTRISGPRRRPERGAFSADPALTGMVVAALCRRRV